jgi:hypothetical protein
MTQPADRTSDVLRDAARGTPCPDADRLASAHGELRVAMADVRGALGEFDRVEHEAWAAYARTVDRAIVHLEAELEMSTAQLAVLQATSSDDLAATVRRAGTSLAAMTDEARVQRHLAELEVRDHVDHATSALHRTIEGVTSQAGHDLEVLRTEAGRALDGIRHAFGGLRPGASGRARTEDDGER